MQRWQGAARPGMGMQRAKAPSRAHGPLLCILLLLAPQCFAWAGSTLVPSTMPLRGRAVARRGSGAGFAVPERGGGMLRGLVGGLLRPDPPSPLVRGTGTAFRDPHALTALSQAAIPLLLPPKRSMNRPSPPAALLAASFCVLVSLVASGFSQEGGAGWLSLSFFASNVPATVMCFAAADALAQLLEKRARPDFVRMASASFVGIVVNAIGFSFWLHYLDLHIPSELVSLGAPSGMTSLATKALLDSFAWGTTSNTISIIGRRLLAGDSLERAVALWNRNIIAITRSEFAFWPLWQAVNFCLVPSGWQVAFTSLGALTWNTFLSLRTAAAHNTNEDAHGH